MCGILKEQLHKIDKPIIVWKVINQYRDGSFGAVSAFFHWEVGKVMTDPRFRTNLAKRKMGREVSTGVFHSFKYKKDCNRLLGHLEDDRNRLLPAVIPAGSYCADIENDGWNVCGSCGYASSKLIIFKTIEEAEQYVCNQ